MQSTFPQPGTPLEPIPDVDLAALEAVLAESGYERDGRPTLRQAVWTRFFLYGNGTASRYARVIVVLHVPCWADTAPPVKIFSRFRVETAPSEEASPDIQASWEDWYPSADRLRAALRVLHGLYSASVFSEP